MFTSNDWNPSDSRRWNPDFGPNPIYGRCGDTNSRVSRQVSEKKRLRREYAKLIFKALPFKVWSYNIKLQRASVPLSSELNYYHD